MSDLRASGSGRRPQRRMARLQISGHYAYPAVYALGAARRSDRSRLGALNVMLTPCPVVRQAKPQAEEGGTKRSRSLSATQSGQTWRPSAKDIQGNLGGVQQVSDESRVKRPGGLGVPESVLREVHKIRALAGFSSKTDSSRCPAGKFKLSSCSGLSPLLQAASSTSPWLFDQVSSEVFSKSSSVMSSLLLLS